VTETDEVHLLLPEGYDDAGRPSGGNRYDQQVVTGLDALGWTVVVHPVPDAWPAPGPAVAAVVERALAVVPAGRVVVVDGLVAAAAEQVLVRHSTRLRLVALVHMTEPPGGPSDVLLRAARLVIVTSQQSARVLLGRNGLEPSQVVVAPPGAPSAEPATGTAAEGALLCVAAVVEPKGHDVLFAALARLAGRPGAADDAWTCVCAGDLDRDPDFVAGLRRALTGSGIAGRVRLTGTLAGAELDAAYAAADVLVLASRHEGFGMVVTEALARGLPVIATSVGGVPEALGHAADGRRPGILVPPDDPDALAGAVAAWLDDADLREGLRSAARSRRDGLRGWPATVGTISAALSAALSAAQPIASSERASG
jgi:glycosyltransferase involved in cell wall biosynthesis